MPQNINVLTGKSHHTHGISSNMIDVEKLSKRRMQDTQVWFDKSAALFTSRTILYNIVASYIRAYRRIGNKICMQKNGLIQIDLAYVAYTSGLTRINAANTICFPNRHKWNALIKFRREYIKNLMTYNSWYQRA